MDIKGQLIPALIRYAHFIGIFLMVSCVVMQHLIAKGRITRDQLKRASILNKIYGVAAIVTLIAGLFLWMGQKWAGIGVMPKDIYSHNPITHIKTGLFLVAAGLSVLPTIYFKRSQKLEEESFTVPIYIVQVLRIQLAIYFIMPLLATLMGRQIGYRPKMPEPAPQVQEAESSTPAEAAYNGDSSDPLLLAAQHMKKNVVLPAFDFSDALKFSPEDLKKLA